MTFLSTFGRLPGTWLTLVLIVLSGMIEGFGLVLFVPLLEIMTAGSPEGLRWPFTLIVDGFRAIGVPVTLPSMLGAIVVLILGSMGLGYSQRYVVIRAWNLFSRRVREDFNETFFHASWGHISRQSHGEVINQFVTECRRAGKALQYEVLCVASIIQIAIYFAFSSVLSWQLMLVTALFGIIVVVVVRPLQLHAKAYGKATNTANRNLSFYGLDFLKGAKLVKATACEEMVVTRLVRHITTLYEVGFRSELNGVQIYFLAQALPVMLLAMIIFIAIEVLDVNPSSTLVFLLILARLVPRMAQLQQQFQSYSLNSPAVGVVDAMIQSSHAEKEETTAGGHPFERLERGIRLENVGYRYPDEERTVVEDVNLEIPVNRMAAVVGSSGAGKSTLIDIICGLRPPATGRITIDGTDLWNLDPFSWRRCIGYVPQDAVIFNDTLRNNLLFAHPEADDGTIARVLDLVHLSDTVAELPQGLDTVLGEGGIRLSGGQKQRLALARALVGGPQLLLLDEATSALDTESEFRIQKAIESIAHTITIVVVAHRLSTVRKADVIHVMENGRIVESGTYDDLLARDGRFTQLHDVQFS